MKTNEKTLRPATAGGNLFLRTFAKRYSRPGVMPRGYFLRDLRTWGEGDGAFARSAARSAFSASCNNRK